MSNEINLPPELLRRAFPCYLAISPELKIVEVGPVLQRLLPSLQGAPPFAEVFVIERALGDGSFSSLCALTNTVIVLSVKASALRLRGEFLEHQGAGVLLFVGSPKLIDFAELAPLGLSLQDFAAHDSVQDFLYSAQAQRTALAEARALTEQLQQRQSELKQLHQQATSASKLKTELLTNMSHEVRTPLHAIIGLSQLLLESQLSREQRDQVLTVNIESKHLLTIFTNLLELSALIAGGLKTTNESIDLWSLAESTLSPFAEAALQKGLTLLCRISKETPRRVEGDPTLLRLALTHLIQNALKFTERGEISLRIQYQNNTCTFDVIDSGIGLQIDSPETLFTPFSQADSSSTRRFGGMGLGLAIVAEIAKMLSGETGCEDREEGGSRFWLSLPLRALPYKTKQIPLRILVVEPNFNQRSTIAEMLVSFGAHLTTVKGATEARQACLNAQPFEVVLARETELALIQELKQEKRARYAIMLSESPSPQRELRGVDETLPLPLRITHLLDRLTELSNNPPATRAGGRILVVEDNPVNQKLAKLFLESLGYEVAQALDGVEAIKATQQSTYAVILMDCQMPRCDGYEATRVIRAQERHPQPPIIAMTANVTRGAKEACLSAGMDDYLPKPVQFYELQRMLARWVKEAPSEEAPASPLEHSILDQLRAISPKDGDELASEIVGLYLRDSKKHLRDLRSALDGGSLLRAQHTAHTLKGSAGNVGATAVSKAAASLEAALKQGDLQEARAQLPLLLSAFTAAEQALSLLLKKPSQ